MAAIDWPAGLPLARSGALTEQPISAYVDDGADVGMARRRKRFTRTLRIFSFTLRLTNAQLATLRTFIDTTSDGGVLRFNWTHPVTSVAYEVRFQSLPSVQQYFNGVWDAAITLEQV